MEVPNKEVRGAFRCAVLGELEPHHQILFLGDTGAGSVCLHLVLSTDIGEERDLGNFNLAISSVVAIQIAANIIGSFVKL